MLFFRRKTTKPTIIERADHCISRRDIDPDALKVLYRLSSLGHNAFLVGGSVRDLLLGRTPKDFDVGTDARPNEIRRIFRNCFLVGRRFRLAHIVFGRKVIETATFRKAPDSNAVQDEHGLYQSEDNTFGTPEEDARRRDFTVNGLFYDIKTFAVIDYVDGLKDLKSKTLRCIGDPAIRFREDPVRMMRAVRFAAKLGFTICPADVKAIKKYAGDLVNASVSRLCEEIQRLFVRGNTCHSIRLAYDLGVLRALLPQLCSWLDAREDRRDALWHSLGALDALADECEPSAAVAMAALYWPMVHEEVLAAQAAAPAGSRRPNERYLRKTAAQKALAPIVAAYRLPRAVWMTAVDILELSARFQSAPRPEVQRDIRFVTHGIFPEALLGARWLACLLPDAPWKIEAWQQFYATRCPVRTNRNGEPQPPLNPHSRKARRRRPRRRKSGDRPAHEDTPKADTTAQK